jgi:predicted O-linked N-acetylglucosamine transferase (SPINDLY family)
VKLLLAGLPGAFLTEIGCSELVVSSFEEYEKKAIELASQPDKIISLKRKILDLDKTSNLFKPKKFTLDLESKMIDLMN